MRADLLAQPMEVDELSDEESDFDGNDDEDDNLPNKRRSKAKPPAKRATPKKIPAIREELKPTPKSGARAAPNATSMPKKGDDDGEVKEEKEKRSNFKCVSSATSQDESWMRS
jgi:hypothetical protein